MHRFPAILLTAAVLMSPGFAQETPPGPKPDRVQVSPAMTEAEVGQTLRFSAIAFDTHGKQIDAKPTAWFAAPFDVGAADEAGLVTVYAPGDLRVGAIVNGKTGWTDMADEIDGYRPIEGVEVPEASVYLLTDVSTGPETLNVRPADALPMIRAAGRTPLTVDEGVALVTQLPTSLTELNAFQAVGSRTGNKRIPSFWMSKGAPRLGWCWEGNPHTWLGSASAAARMAP